jgi:hypothetical protein
MLIAKFRKYQNYKKSATLKMTIIIKTLSLNSKRIEMIFDRFSLLRKRKKNTDCITINLAKYLKYPTSYFKYQHLKIKNQNTRKLALLLYR